MIEFVRPISQLQMLRQCKGRRYPSLKDLFRRNGQADDPGISIYDLRSDLAPPPARSPARSPPRSTAGRRAVVRSVAFGIGSRVASRPRTVQYILATRLRPPCRDSCHVTCVSCRCARVAGRTRRVVTPDVTRNESFPVGLHAQPSLLYVVFCFLSDHKPRARPVRKVRGAIVTLHNAAWLSSCQTRCALSNESRGSSPDAVASTGCANLSQQHRKR